MAHSSAVLFKQGRHPHFHLYDDCEPAPEFLDRSSRRSPSHALQPDQPNWRPTDKLQILSWNPGPARGSDPSLLASHLNGPWHGICVQERSGFVTNKFPGRRTSTWSPSTTVPYSSRRTPSSTTSLVHRFKSHVLCGTRHGLLKAWWSCSYFTIVNIHINNERAERRSVCIALLLLVGDLCLKLGAVVLTGDFNKAVEMDTSSGDGERRTSPMEAAFRHTNIPWPTGGVTPLWGPGGEQRQKMA